MAEDLDNSSSRWPASASLLAIVAVIGADQVLVGILSALPGLQADDGKHFTATGTTLVALSLDFLLIGIPILFIAATQRPTLKGFGLRGFKPKQTILWVSVAVASYVALSSLWALLVSTQEKQEIVERLGTDQSTLKLLIAVLLLTVIAPFAEEFFFRGYLFASLRNWRGPWPAALIVGTIFGLVHLGSSPAVLIPPLALLGGLLCMVYQRTGSLYPCIALHAINNAIALTVALTS